MKKQLVFALASMAAFAGMLIVWTTGIEASVNGDSIAIKFGANEPAPEGSALPDDAVAGAAGVESANWNNARDSSGRLDDLARDTMGKRSATSAAVIWLTTNTWFSGGNNNFTGNNRTLMQGYLDQNVEPAIIRVTIQGLPDDMATGYNVYIYYLGDSSRGRGGVYTVNNQSKFGFIGADFRGPDFVDAGGLVPPSKGNYLVWQGLTGPTVMITADNDIDFRSPINGVEIVAAPPK